MRFPTYYWFRCHYPLITYLNVHHTVKSRCSVKKLEFLRPFSKAPSFFAIMFRFGSAELKTKSLLTTPSNVLPLHLVFTSQAKIEILITSCQILTLIHPSFSWIFLKTKMTIFKIEALQYVIYTESLV